MQKCVEILRQYFLEHHGIVTFANVPNWDSKKGWKSLQECSLGLNNIENENKNQFVLILVSVHTMKTSSSEYNSRESKSVQQTEVDISKPDSVNVHQAGLN